MRLRGWPLLLVSLAGCGPGPVTGDAGWPGMDAAVADSAVVDAAVADAAVADASIADASIADGGPQDAGTPREPDWFADRVVRFDAGPGAGFGQDSFPAVVLGPPQGAGSSAGSLDVLSLGREGLIELEFTDVLAVDGPGPDLAVFENPFTGFLELGQVSVSADGVDWRAFPCDSDAGTGCAGLRAVHAWDGGTSREALLGLGGDQFDLAEVGLSTARFVRVQDTGSNRFYGAPGGGFDLDAVAVLSGRLVDGGVP